MRQRHLLCFAASMALVADKANVGWLVPRQGVPRLPSPVASGRRVAVAVRAVDGTRQPSNTWSKTSTKLIKKAFLCSAFVILSAIGPILFDWVKRHNAGRFPFFVPALVFHAWAIDGLLGLAWAASQGREGLSALWRPDMLWRFFITTSLFVAGDMAFQVTNSIKAKAVGLSQRIQRQLSITSPKLGECLVNRSQNLQHFPWPLTSGFTSDLRDLVPSSPASHKAVPHRESSKRIVKAKSVNDGKQVDMEFADGTAFRFHTGWMKDSHPNLVGEDTYRKSAQTILENDQYTAEMLNLSSDGSLISVHFKNHSNQKGVTEEYPSDWLHAFAPYVGSPLNNSSYMNKGSGLPDTGSLLEDIYKNRKPWDSTLEIPKFSGPELLKDENLQIQFLETMMETGVAMISDIGKPQSLQDVDCGKPLEDFVFSIIGRINQHPVRATRFGVIHSEAAVAENSSDYDCKNPLSMHTDHSHYHGTPGYLQFMYQARGSVTSKVCDGLAVAEYLREHHPKDFEMLSKVNVTHSIRNSIYAKDGGYNRESNAGGYTFELAHTHPILCLDEDGHLSKVVQSETKRGVSALPFEIYEPYMNAYKRWVALLEEDRFKCKFDWPEHSMVVMNNHRVLHGRAEVPPGVKRSMVFGYVMKTVYENSYRLLKQRQAEQKSPEMNHKWLTRLPNQVLTSLVN
eukprot:symbB.v1.2.003014.t1/scaffold113.1/size324549/12